MVKKRPTVPLHKPSKFKPSFVAGFDAILHVASPWLTKGIGITSVQESEHDDDGGGSKGGGDGGGGGGAFGGAEVQHGGSA